MKRGLLVALALCGAIGAHAYSVFDFEEFNATSSVGGGTPGALTTLSSTKNGLTLTVTRSAGAAFDIFDNDSLVGTGFSMPLTFDHRTLDPFSNEGVNDYFVGNFSTAVSAAEVEMTDFGGDSDTLEMQVWSGLGGTGTMIADQFTSWGTNSSPNFAAVGWNGGTGAAARSILFRGGDGGTFPNSMYIDNIAAQAVPEPASIAALGIGALALIRKRSKK